MGKRKTSAKKKTAKQSKSSTSARTGKGRTDHLKEHQFKPGQSGNPKGSAKGMRLSTALTKLFDQKVSKVPVAKKYAEKLGIKKAEMKDMTCAELLMVGAFQHSLGGKDGFLRQMWERSEGAVPRALRLSSDDPVELYLDRMRETTEPPSPPSSKRGGVPIPEMEAPGTIAKAGGNGNGNGKRKPLKVSVKRGSRT